MLLSHLTRELCSFTSRDYIAAVVFSANFWMILLIGDGAWKARSSVKCVLVAIVRSDRLASNSGSRQIYGIILLVQTKFSAKITYKRRPLTNMKRIWRLWRGFVFCVGCKAVGLTTRRKAAHVDFIRFEQKIRHIRRGRKKGANGLHGILSVGIATSHKRFVV